MRGTRLNDDLVLLRGLLIDCFFNSSTLTLFFDFFEDNNCKSNEDEDNNSEENIQARVKFLIGTDHHNLNEILTYNEILDHLEQQAEKETELQTEEKIIRFTDMLN